MSTTPECSICAEELDDPRALPCGHSYCGPQKNCLTMLKQTNGAIKCALCNEVHHLDIGNLKPLFGIREFLNSSGKQVASKSSKPAAFSRCPTHPSSPVLFWCVQCSEKICQTCFETQHDGHAMKSYKVHLQNSVSAKLKEVGAQRESFIENMNKRIESIQDHISALDSKIKAYEGRKVVLEKEIEKLDLFRINEAKIRAFSKGTSVEIDTPILDSFLNLPLDLAGAEAYTGLNTNGLTLCSEFIGFRSWVAGESHDSDGVILSKGYKLWIRAKR